MRSLCFILVFLLVSFSFAQNDKKLLNFRKKLEEIRNSNIGMESFSQLPNVTSNGRVFYPIGYGADPSGKEDSSIAIQKAIEEGFAVESEVELLPGISDLGGVIIDLQGGNYNISQPIRLSPGIGNILITGGTLRASNTFPGDRHLIELWSPISITTPQETSTNTSHHGFTNAKEKIFYEDITFRDILFDSSFRGGGLFIIDSARIRIHDCFFLHFTTQGIIAKRGHETFISNCFLGQKSTIGGDLAEKHFAGTAIDLQSNDNAITDVVVFSAAIGVVLRGQANIITGVHCYNKASSFGGIGILLAKLSGVSNTRIDNCYMDFTAIVLEDPVQVHVTNGFFLGDANVILKSIDGRISGLNIVDNMFSGNPRNMVPIVRLDGFFSSVDQVVVERNNVIGMSLKSTSGKLVVVGNGTKWVADFSQVLLFPNRVNHLQYSFYVHEGIFKFSSHAVTNVSNNIVVVESKKAVNGKVYVAIDQQ